MCAGVCAVLNRLGRGSEYKHERMLHPRWLLKNHPLFPLVKCDIPLALVSGTALVEVPAHTEPLAASSVPPQDVLRHAVLTNLFKEVLNVKSPFYEQLRDALLRQKQVLLGQATDHVPMFAPAPQLSAAQQNVGIGSASDAVNLSRMPTSANGYNRGAGNRVQTARNKDPSAYSVHSTAVLGTRVLCPCGAEILNTKGARAYHRANHKGHLAWVASWHARANVQSQQASAIAAVSAAASSITALDAELECGSSEESDSADIRPASCEWSCQGDDTSEDVNLVHIEPQDNQYYLNFGNLTRKQYGVQCMQRCWVQIGAGAPTAGVPIEAFFMKVKRRQVAKTMTVILWYNVVDEAAHSIGYFASSRVSSRDSGWSCADGDAGEAHFDGDAGEA